MKYMLLVYLDENLLSEGERQRCYADSARLARDLAKTGNHINVSPLQLTSSATSVRLRDGKRMVTDGPFAETREQLGGFYLIKANNLDEAITIAERVPVVNVGTIEIKPVLEIPDLPDGVATRPVRQAGLPDGDRPVLS